MTPEAVPVWVAVLATFAGATVGLFCGALCSVAGKADGARDAYAQGQADALTTPATEALIRSVAIATVELVAEEYVTDPAVMMARRDIIARQILEATQGAARDFGGNAA